ncbi:transcriptional regulator [Candidatus Saccharibacteria bacterium CG_4_9_14_0_2_um_filter_41_9]|nr:helix-turn-helix transcriptional regulator [Candidatus Saccharibacteria bacterium]PIZ60890.1 MAG: transcriptional regulator [Candidatus Saccharibacteria bacterium CG_4_10_14_0_2_um_filter_41_11]PJC29600.1 MAG: transcriptional regulator [Candidatus Saccharibacteria bacterium CG_4_9_14_0_2_um_filter_41_9]
MNKIDTSKFPTFEEFKAEALSDPEVKKEYDALEAEFALIDSLISARLEKKMTQSELAKKAGMKQEAVARLEGGDSNPTFATLTKIAKALDKKVVLA